MSDETKEKDRHVFKVTETVKDKEIVKELAIKKPSAQEGIEAQKVYSKEWADALKRGAPLRAQVEDILIERGLWSKEKQARLIELAKDIEDGSNALKRGNIKLSEAKEIAFRTRAKRFEFNSLALEKNILDNGTVEGQAEIARINYLISVCTVYNHNDKKYYDGLADYYNKAYEKVAQEATNAYMTFVYNIEPDFEKKYTENEFLLERKLINDKLQRLDSDGNPVTEDGTKRINELGQLINDDGEAVDSDGHLIDEKGERLSEKKLPFLDDDGNPILE